MIQGAARGQATPDRRGIPSVQWHKVGPLERCRDADFGRLLFTADARQVQGSGR